MEKISKKKEKEIYQTIAREQPYCQLCGSTNMLVIHHVRYGACGRKTYFGNVIRLCDSCHKKVHSNKRKWQSVLIEIANQHEKNVGRN